MDAVNQPLLDVRDLSVAFHQPSGTSVAVDRISFSILRGQCVALVGESGSGKSVSALSVLKLLPYPSASHPSGSILFKGRELLKLSENEMRSIRGNDISIIFQEPMTSLNPLHTIEMQIGEVLRLHNDIGSRMVRERTLELLTQVGIPDPQTRLGSYPHQLSGGQRQRVMIAMALANEPDLLIADEPTTALDVTVQAQLIALLKDIQKRLGMSLLFITHDLGIVRKLADRVCVMKDGKIVEAGTVSRVFAAPEHPYTQALLAAEPKPDPAPLQPDAPVVLDADHVKVWFALTRGVLRKVVGHVKACDGVSIKLHQGETLGIVGESGSGKSTLGRAILRLISSEGSIVFMGSELQNLRFKEMLPFRRDMQIVFQDPYGSLSPRMSVAEIIKEGLKVHHPKMSNRERDQRVIQALNDVGLDPELRFRFPHEFSGGQRQRIAVARAVVLEPHFIVLDEPTSALDMLIQAQMVDLLRDLQKRRNLTYLFISHDLRVVAALSSRLIVMRHGQVVEAGDAAELFRNPKSDYTRALLAAGIAVAALLAGPAAAQDRDRSMATVAEIPLTGDDGQVVPNHAVKLLGPIDKLPGVVTVGNPNGKTALVEFYDLNCPYCRIASSDIADMVDLDRELKLVLVPFPVLGIPSITASRVELAVAKLGTPRQFYEFHRKVYAQRGVTDGARALEIARSLGLDTKALTKLADSDGITETMIAHVRLGNSLGLAATPAFIIDGVAILGYPGRYRLQAIVDASDACGKVVCD